jgi:hypothetical protein
VPPKRYTVDAVAQLEARAVRELARLRTQKQRKQQLDAAALARARVTAVRDLTAATLLTAGFPSSTFTVAGDGNRVDITLSRADACSAKASDAGTISSSITGILNISHGVRMHVAGTKLSLARYLKGNCPQSQGPEGSGKLLYNTSSSGIVMTPAISVRHSAWTIEWESRSSQLQVYLYKGGKLVSVLVNEIKRGSGQTTLTGAGRYQLKIAGTADWSVRVRDGA